MKNTVVILALAGLFAGGSAAAGDWGRSTMNFVPATSAYYSEECLSYDFVDLEYLYTDFGSPYFRNGHGYRLSFSKELGARRSAPTYARSRASSAKSPAWSMAKAPARVAPQLGSGFYIAGAYDWTRYDDTFCGCNDRVSRHRFRLGAGVRRSISDCVDLTFEGGGLYMDSDSRKDSTRGFDSWGYYFGPGIRARAGRLEFFATAYYYHRSGDRSQIHIDPEFRSNRYRTDPYGWVFTPGVIYHVTDRLGLKASVEFDRYDTALLVGGRYHY